MSWFRSMCAGWLVAVSFVACTETPAGPADGEGEPEDLSSYIAEVFDYVYAPGQHAPTRNAEDAEFFVGKPDRELYLGGFGGYVVAGFDHDVPNGEGADFEVYSSGVDAEPAVVYVMCDENGDGLPNETWYELAGSEAGHAETIRDYEVTYYKPAVGGNVRWRDNRGNSGELLEGNRKDPATGNFRTTESWWWSETVGDSVSFKGTHLPDVYYNAGTDSAENWVIRPDMFAWGYAENNKGDDYDKKTRANRLDISNAVDASGHPVVLPHVRFIKIQTAVFQRAGWLNEVSAEVLGARDLHTLKNPAD